MVISKLKKLLGIGPAILAMGIILLATGVWADYWVIHLAIMTNPVVIRIIGGIMAYFGVALHLWSLSTLTNWWLKDELCTKGPFKWFRHPMYAAWVTFILPGVALLLNSYTVLFFVALLHLICHLLVVEEERIMQDTFQDQYLVFAARTGRFIPRIWNR
jgi:protein-S-isoprenylcysteine O-methyltransferase Ste14